VISREPTMPDDTIQIATYTYHLLSSLDEDEVALFLYDDGANVVGRVGVVADDRPMPPAERRGHCSFLYYRRPAFRDVVDMLRNEGPVYLTWRDGMNAALGTGFEPVGEGETSA
jgi:hypothetical protein